MSVFLFKVLPILALAALVAGIVFTSKGISGGSKKMRLAGVGCIVLFVLLLSFAMLQALARM